MNATLSSAIARTRRPSIYLPLVLLAAAIATAGFWKTYFGPLFGGMSRSDWVTHLHAGVFMGWIGLVGLQAMLAARGRLALHRTVGRVGMVYGAVLVGVGLTYAGVRVGRRIVEVGVERIPDGAFLAPITDMMAFSIFLAGAWFTRTRPEFHRRFILLATTTLLIAAVGRLFQGTRSIALPDVAPFVLVWLSPVWIAMLHDWVRSRTVHVVYVVGALLLVAIRYRQVIRETDAWVAISRRLVRWVAAHFT